MAECWQQADGQDSAVDQTNAVWEGCRNRQNPAETCRTSRLETYNWDEAVAADKPNRIMHQNALVAARLWRDKARDQKAGFPDLRLFWRCGPG